MDAKIFDGTYFAAKLLSRGQPAQIRIKIGDLLVEAIGQCAQVARLTEVFLQEFAPELKGLMETATALERQQILEELQACQVAVAAVRET